MPPDFWAAAGAATQRMPASAPAAAAIARKLRSMPLSFLQPREGDTTHLLVEPEVFEALAVVDAVDLGHEAFEPGVAVRSSGVEEDRTGVVLDQLALDFPDNLLSLLRVRLRRLLVHQLVDFGIAIAGIVARGAAYIILIERHIRIVDCRLGDIDRDLVILAHQLRIPLGGID